MEVTVGFDPTLVADTQTLHPYGRQMSVSDATRHRERRLTDLKHIHELGWKILKAVAMVTIVTAFVIFKF